MKKKFTIQLLVASAALSLAVQSLQAFTSKTFFSPRAIGSDLTLQHVGSSDFIFNNEPADRFFASTTSFYQNSVNSQELSKYFLPSGKTELLIKGALAPVTATSPAADISATWLRIAGKNNTLPADGTFPAGTNFTAGGPIGGALVAGGNDRQSIELVVNEFQSKIKINPEYKSFGSIVQFQKNLGFISDKLWFSMTLPFVQVETNVKLNEFDIQNAATSRDDIKDFVLDDGTGAGFGSAVRISEAPSLEAMLNATEAFNNPQWKYGKITNGVQQRTGLADINIKLGYKFSKASSRDCSIYGSLVIPTGYKPTAEKMFEPLIGNNNHWALGAGLLLNMNFVQHKNFNADFSSNLDFQYLLSNVQKRSFDLKKNGEWSRYLLVSTNNTQFPVPGSLSDTLQPGINFFTQNVKVEPKYEINWLNGFDFSVKNITFACGHTLWIKSNETLTLKSSFADATIALVTTDFGVADAGTALNSAQSFSKATITQNLTDFNKKDPALTFLSASDLDLQSGLAPFRASNKFHAVVGLNEFWKENPVHVHVGGSYEFAATNASLDSWMIWLKMHLSV